jgi:hypothetical protein
MNAAAVTNGRGCGNRPTRAALLDGSAGRFSGLAAPNIHRPDARRPQKNRGKRPDWTVWTVPVREGGTRWEKN